MSDPEFVRVLDKDELPEGSAKTVEIAGKKILLVNDEGEIYALSAHCTHDGEELNAAEVHDHEVECPRHGARFSVETGDVTRMPAVYGLATYDVRVENGQIHVEVD